MFCETLDRFNNKKVFEEAIILANVKHENLVKQEMFSINSNNPTIVFEPEVKSTAPAMSAVIEYLMRLGKFEDIVVFLPSDAYINNISDFEKYLLKGEELAKNDKIVCFGVQPLYPETGYGYIKIGEKIGEDKFLVDKFVEKPNFEKAVEFTKSNEYLWNAGIFMTKVSVLSKLFEEFQPELISKIRKNLDKSNIINNSIYLDKDTFSEIEEISIDYAIIENLNSANLATVSMNLIWSDVGSFNSLYLINNDKTKEKNIIKGKVLLNNTENCYIRGKNKIICCSDVDDLVIVEEDDVILIMKKDKSQNVKNLLKKCKEENLEAIL